MLWRVVVLICIFPGSLSLLRRRDEVDESEIMDEMLEKILDDSMEDMLTRLRMAVKQISTLKALEQAERLKTRPGHRNGKNDRQYMKDTDYDDFQHEERMREQKRLLRFVGQIVRNREGITHDLGDFTDVDFVGVTPPPEMSDDAPITKRPVAKLAVEESELTEDEKEREDEDKRFLDSPRDHRMSVRLEALPSTVPKRLVLLSERSAGPSLITAEEPTPSESVVFSNPAQINDPLTASQLDDPSAVMAREERQRQMRSVSPPAWLWPFVAVSATFFVLVVATVTMIMKRRNRMAVPFPPLPPSIPRISGFAPQHLRVSTVSADRDGDSVWSSPLQAYGK